MTAAGQPRNFREEAENQLADQSAPKARLKVKLYDKGPSAEQYAQVIKLFEDMKLNGTLKCSTPGDITANNWEALCMHGTVTTGDPSIFVWWKSACHIYFTAPDFYNGEPVPRTSSISLSSRRSQSIVDLLQMAKIKATAAESLINMDDFNAALLPRHALTINTEALSSSRSAPVSWLSLLV